MYHKLYWQQKARITGTFGSQEFGSRKRDPVPTLTRVSASCCSSQLQLAAISSNAVDEGSIPDQIDFIQNQWDIRLFREKGDHPLKTGVGESGNETPKPGGVTD